MSTTDNHSLGNESVISTSLGRENQGTGPKPKAEEARSLDCSIPLSEVLLLRTSSRSLEMRLHSSLSHTQGCLRSASGFRRARVH